jgi:hypothetical protein
MSEFESPPNTQATRFNFLERCAAMTVPFCDLEHDILRLILYSCAVKSPFRLNWLLRLLALVAITVSGGALANQYFLRLEQTPKLAKPNHQKQALAKPTVALFEQKRLEPPIFNDAVPSANSNFLPQPRFEVQEFQTQPNLKPNTAAHRSERSRAPPTA